MASLYSPSAVPGNFASNSSSINVGLAFFVSSAATAVGIRFYKNPSDPTTAHTVSLWDVATHANLAQQVSSGETASGWQEVTLTTPVALTANKAYRVSVFTSASAGTAYYGYTSNVFTSPFTNGIITGYQTGAAAASSEPNNTYDFNSTADYPTGDSGVAANFYVDINVTAGGTNLHFPMAIVDTSTVALGFHGAARRFPMAIVDTSTVAIGFHGAGGGGGGAILKVQGPLNAIGTSVHILSKAYTANVTAGNFLVAFGNCLPGSGTSGAVTDSLGQTWTQATTWTFTSGVVGAVFYKANTLGGACTVTLTCGASDSFPDLTIFEFSGIITASPADGTNQTAGTSAAPSSGNITTTNAADLLFSGCVTAGSGVTAGESGWTFGITPNDNAYQYNIVSATGTYAATFVSASAGYLACLAAFKGTTVTALHFPMAMADTSAVALGFHGVAQHFPMAMADTSTVALGFHGPVSLAPQLVNHVATGMANTPINTLTVRFPDPVLAGNCLVCFVQCNNAGTITSVKDNLGNSFTLGPTYTNSTYSKRAACYYLPNATAGVTYVQITFSGLSANVSGGYGIGYPQADISQWYNVATTSPLDVSSSSNSSKSSGSMTTTVAGDLILYWAIDLSDNGGGGAFNGTSITKGSGFTLLTADRQIGSVVQYQVQGTAGAINPTCTTSGAATWGSLAIALKAATAGTAPSATAMRIVSEYHCSFSGNNAGTPVYSPVINNVQFPCQGNLLVVVYQAEGQITNVTDSNSNSWLRPSSANITSSGSNQTSQIVYAAAVTPSDSLAVNFTFVAGTLYPLGVFYDVVNAHSSPFDLGNTAQGSNTVWSAATIAITPTSANGLIFSMQCVQWDSANALNSPAGGTLDAIVNDLETNNNGTVGTQASTLDEDAGIAHYYNPAAASVTFSYGANTSGQAGGGTAGPGGWSAAVAAFKTAQVSLHFGLAIADTSGVQLAFHAGTHFPLAIADTSGVQLGFHIGGHFPLVINDTSGVQLGFHQITPLHFPLAIADTSSVQIGFHQTAPLHFPLAINDISTVALGFRVQRRFPVQAASSSTVMIGWRQIRPDFPVIVADTSAVRISFGNDHYTPPVPLFVPPYCGQDQPSSIGVTADIAWRESQREEGCWALPPYASIFPNGEEGGTDVVPPPIQKTDLWNSMQTFPL